MIKICRVTHPKKVYSGQDFKIRYTVFFLSLPWLLLYSNLKVNGDLAIRKSRRAYFFFGWFNVEYISSIESKTDYVIEAGYDR